MINKVFLSLLALNAHANANCFDEAGREFDVNPLLIKAVCFTESSFDAKAINSDNSNGSTDYGLCQINSWWFDRIEQYGITPETLLNDPCENTRVSAWILAQNFETSGEGWLAVGAYNAGYEKTPEKDTARKIYIAKVKENLRRMQE
jgi:soluble lytic murein transglycosylase-like protein